MNKRHRLPANRTSITNAVTIGGKTTLTFCVGMFPDGQPGELFGLELEGEDVTPALMGLLDAWATDVSLLLQTGYSVQDLCKKHIDVCFEPNGYTDNKEIHSCRSLVDYIVRWMFIRFHKEEA